MRTAQSHQLVNSATSCSADCHTTFSSITSTRASAKPALRAASSKRSGSETVRRVASWSTARCRRKVAIDDLVEQVGDATARRPDRHAGGEPGRGTQDAMSLVEGAVQVRSELQAVPARRRVKRRRRKRQLLDVHQLEPGVWDRARARHLDHPQREVDADDLATWRHSRREPDGQVARPAREVENAHPRPGVDGVEHPMPPARLAARHDLVESAVVRLRVPAEDRRVQVFRLHRQDLSSQAAARSAPALVRPTTWMPTGRPST